MSKATEALKALDRARYSVVNPQREDTPSRPAPRFPQPLAAEARHGLAGDFVRAVEPHSEADPVALLVQFLATFGSVIGRHAYIPVEADRHYSNLFTVVTGDTARARKGTSWGYPRKLFESLDPNWKQDHLKSGLSSGEGLVHAVRDHIDGSDDLGVRDKRLLVFEGEFSSVLKNFKRDGNKLSAVIRDAWDHGNLGSLTKNDPARATGAHISMIGHITREELSRDLSTTEMANGFGNRILWVAVRRSKKLAFGGDTAQVESAFNRMMPTMQAAVEFGKRDGAVKLDQAARVAWETYYTQTIEETPGVLGQMTARDTALILRLSLIYALLDQSSVITVAHLNAAIALWDYSFASCRYLFGDSTGDTDADRILDFLLAEPGGMTQTEISERIFGRHRTAARIADLLQLLERTNTARSVKESTGGRPVTRWFAAAGSERSEESELSEPKANPPDSDPQSSAVVSSHHSLNSHPAQPDTQGPGDGPARELTPEERALAFFSNADEGGAPWEES